MTLAVTHDRDSMTPALAGSALLHLTVAALFLMTWPWTRELKMGTVVPVQIVSNAPSTDVRPAIEAAEVETAATPEPVPDASLQAPGPPAPEPALKPAPAAPAAKPPPVAEKAPGRAQPTAKAVAKPAPPQEVDLDRLLASVSKSGKAGGGGAARSSAPRGPARPETATQARPAVGAGVSAMALAGLQTELQRRWNPNCDVEGGRDVQVRVTFSLGSSGMVLGDVGAGGAEHSPNPVVRAAAERAIRAVYAAAPFRNLPREYYGDRIAVNFNAQEACL